MGATKDKLFTDYQNTIASYAKALAHPARIAILQQLAQMESCVCGDLVQDIGLAQPTVSQHLKALKSAGLIKGTIEGVRVCYCIDKVVFEQVKGEFNSLFENLDFRLNDECC